VYGNPVIAPAVPEGTARIRLSCMAIHTEAQLSFALEKLQKVGRRMGLIP
jgi:7-keto-8-aminopelargonate synthetase-like enzyme